MNLKQLIMIPVCFCCLKCVSFGNVSWWSGINTIVLIADHSCHNEKLCPIKWKLCNLLHILQHFLPSAFFAWRHLRAAIIIESCRVLSLDPLSQSSLVTSPKYPAILPFSSWISLHSLLNGFNDSPGPNWMVSSYNWIF